MPDAPVPPQNLEAEESVLGALLLSPNAADLVQETGLAPDDFYRSSHGAIFRAELELIDKGEPLDVITLIDALESRGALDNVGGRARIHELGAVVPAWANVGHYARIVREAAGFRRLITAGGEISRLGWDRPAELDELLGKAESILTGAVSPTMTTGVASMADEVHALIAEIEESIATGTQRWGLTTGFTDLDRILTGFHPGQLILLAARPSMGKSALAQNMAENIADKLVPAYYGSLEMSKKEIQLRSLSRAAQIDSQKLRTGKLDAAEVTKFREGAATVKTRRALLVEDDGGLSLQKLRVEARRAKRQGLGIIFVDYLQLMVSALGEDNRQQEISNISRGLKLLARELEIPIVALSQLNRNLEIRGDKRPQLSDLRDSGALEQDADVVLFIYRDEYYNPESDQQGMAEIIVAKNRNGASGTVKLAFTKRYTAFRNLAVGLHGGAQAA